MTDIRIASWFGGLGDSLQFSTLPEEFHKQQGRVSYIHAGSPFRNEEIKDLVWGANPYILGTQEGKRNAGDIPEIKYENTTNNGISNWEALHGLRPTNKYPKIYYTPNKIPGLEDSFIADLTSISIDYDRAKLCQSLNAVEDRYSEKKTLHVQFSKPINSGGRETESTHGKFNNYHTGKEDCIMIENLFHYCDVIFSAFGLIALSSGASHLSSAIKKYNPNLKSICLMNEKFHKIHKARGLFLFDNVEYLVH
jgi:hypothetical protein|tara:strand:+ start:28118 stop:28873 length:756 start_codon:yes stop_codon:yes gene_type:complete